LNCVDQALFTFKQGAAYGGTGRQKLRICGPLFKRYR